MKIIAASSFKSISESRTFLENWVVQLSRLNSKHYNKIEIDTSLGKTIVWGINDALDATETLVVFPGYRTSSLFWDFDNILNNLGSNIRVFLVETNGQPNLSDGKTPNIKSLDYGLWAAEVLNELDIKKTHIAGASFGALICMKLCLVSPNRVKSCILLNPGCFRFISLALKNLYFNLLPIVRTSQKNVQKFLNKIVFHKPHHSLSPAAEDLLNQYLLYAITNHKDKNQKPYNMSKEVNGLEIPVHLIFGKNDILIPYELSLKNATSSLRNIQSITFFDNVGHGIETYPEAIRKIYEIINAQSYG